MLTRNKLLIFSILVCIFFTNIYSQAEAEKVISNKQPKIKDLIIVFKMHFDIGYTDLAESVLYNYVTSMTDEALLSVNATSDLAENEKFIWTIPGWPMKYILENTTAERKIGVEKALKDGRFRIHGLPFTIETESSDLENLIRCLDFSTQISKKYNQPLPRDAKMTDVPSHSWILPTLLTNAGIKILHLGCNPGSASPDVPPLFWWEGPDGSRLLTFYWAEYYGSGLIPPENWKYSTWLAMIHTHENTGSPRPEEVAALMKEARQNFPGTRIKIGQLSDFYDAIMKENPEIPVIRGDMPDTWIHGYMSMPREVKKNKQIQRSVYQAQNLNTLNGIWTGNKNNYFEINRMVDKCAENMILFDEHTFGMAISHGQGGPFSYGDEFILNRARAYYDRIEASWREKASRIVTSEMIEKMLSSEVLQNLADAVKVNGKRIVVYNPHPWMRSGEVSMFMNIYKKDKKVTFLKDSVENKIIKVFNKDNLLKFFADNVPAMGYKTYIPAFDGEELTSANQLKIDEINNILENRFFRIKIDPERGIIVSCENKISGKEMVDQKNKYGFGEYIHEQFGQEDLKRYNDSYIKPGAHDWADQEMGRPYLDSDYCLNRSVKGRLSYRNEGNEVSATWFSEMPTEKSHRYSVTWILNENSPFIELLWNIENKQADSRPEAGWITLPFNIDDPSFHICRTGSIVDPLSDFISRTNHDYYFINTGLAITDRSGYGVGLNTPDAPAVSIERSGLYRFSRVYKPKVPTIFINLYNNQWGTNFTEWIEGSWSVRMFIWGIDNYDNEKGLVTPIEETRQPLVGWYSDGKSGNLPLRAEGISLSAKGILVTSFMPINNEDSYRLQLWEQSGKSGICEVSLPIKSVKTAALCNLRGEPIQEIEPIRVTNGRFSINYKSYQPLNLLLK